jgi:DNA-binding NtrC family response regulator
MKQLSILIIGRHRQIMETVVRLIESQQRWRAKGALTDEEAADFFQQEKFDLVLIGGGVEETSEQKLRELFLKKNPDIKIIRHYGGGSGLLFNEIHEALAV